MHSVYLVVGTVSTLPLVYTVDLQESCHVSEALLGVQHFILLSEGIGTGEGRTLVFPLPHSCPYQVL